ncbi:zf-HC2 domain-containing protein [Microbacterium aerolatum]|uniref:Anti-sigma-L factor RslA n=1 Tax=Microbacterium aerolatum TaxID=153731 RepID=A0A511AGM5_9MICO|nr:zf-HC2 domain-containing protein [Microbacterium aerolatum]GEK87278.1 anti-sigma-L factor RslA [Microbacterium aerolatum]GGB14235.1 anti-sigma-L factor RslA [Microbacterium aerolatum]
MNAAHDRFATWDAAYALGALSAPDRAEYEAHLEICPVCRDDVAELVPAAGLLSRLSTEQANAIDAPGEADAAEATTDAGRKLTEIARARRRRRRRVTWAAVGVAAALAVVVPVSIVAGAPRPTMEVALEQVIDAPVSATVALTSVAWGTRIDMACDYAADAPDAGWAYVLAVVGVDGATTELSTWSAEPGRTARLSAGTALPLDEIRAVEIRTDTGEVLLRREIG